MGSVPLIVCCNQVSGPAFVPNKDIIHRPSVVLRLLAGDLLFVAGFLSGSCWRKKRKSLFDLPFGIMKVEHWLVENNEAQLCNRHVDDLGDHLEQSAVPQWSALDFA